MKIDSKIKDIVNSYVGEFDIIKDHRNRSNRTGVLETGHSRHNLWVEFW